jgi:hypothetical protein
MLAFLALMMSAVIAVWSVFNIRSGANGFLALAYGSGLLMYAAHFVTRPPARPEFPPLLNYLWRRHYVTLVLPVAGREISAALNMLRMLGFPWALWLAWHGLWIHAGAAAALFFFMGPLCAWFAPFLYYGEPAKSGDRKAAELLEGLQYVQAWLEAERRRARTSMDQP